MTDYIAQAIREVEDRLGVKSRSFPKGTRASVLKRERMEVLSTAVKNAKADGNYRQVTIDPYEQYAAKVVELTEEMVRGKPKGKLD